MYCARLSGNVIDEDRDEELLSVMSLQDLLKVSFSASSAFSSHFINSPTDI